MENSTNKKYSEILELTGFKIFVKEIDDFFELLESEDIEDESKFKKRLHLSLSKVYSTSFLIPYLELEFDSDFENDQFIKRDKEFANKISKKLKSCDWYSGIFDPFNIDDSDPVQFSLIDDIIDIYYELKIAKLKIEKKKPEYIEDGIWDIIFGRNNHWGTHAVNAIRALHYKLYN
jgi:hypothetical protein